MHAQNQESKTLALFDFDGTLYLHDSFTGFIFHALRKRHIVKRGMQILPWIQAYYLNFYPAHRMRPKLYASMFKTVMQGNSAISSGLCATTNIQVKSEIIKAT